VGEVGLDYASVALSASGGVAPYTWNVSSGALPGGLALGNDGSIGGSPTTAGTFSFTIQVSDSQSGTASLAGSITIAPALTVGLIPACAQYCRVELGCVDVCGLFGELSGGAGPYAYTLTQGPLPAGTSLVGLSLTGTFIGQPGWLQFAVQVTDSLGAVASVNPKFWMYDHVSVAGGSCSGDYGTGCSITLAISGGIPGTNRTVQVIGMAPNSPGPNQPRCWPATPTAGTGSATVAGGFVKIAIPSNLINGYGAVWTIQVTEQTLCAAGTNCTSNEATVVIGVQCG
jgi:hypothetical protein